MRIIKAQFTEESGLEARLSFGSSGRFYAQIRQGAPFDLFLSADEDKIDRLVDDGLAVAESRVTYAQGRLVIWTGSGSVPDVKEALTSLSFNKLAIANPRLAPYGIAATEVLAHLGILEASRDRWVMGENIAQTYLFAATGNADIGLVAASQVMKDDVISKGAGWLVPTDWHSPIRQDAAMLSASTSETAALLLEYLQGPVARKIIRQYGYE